MKTAILVFLSLPWLFLHACGAVDRCIDNNGQWNRELKQCEFASQDTVTSAVYGEWSVVAYDQPGMTALSPPEAKAWLGRIARFSDSLVLFGNDRCESPVYSEDTIPAGRFFEGHRIAPTEVGLADPVIWTTVGCPGDWISPVSRLYPRGSELLLLWDGTFFVLQKR